MKESKVKRERKAKGMKELRGNWKGKIEEKNDWRKITKIEKKLNLANPLYGQLSFKLLYDFFY